MKKINFKLSLMVPFLLFCMVLNGQNAINIWEEVSQEETSAKAKNFRNNTPDVFQLFSLNTTTLKSALEQAPERFNGHSNVVIEIPTHHGEIQKFRVYEAPVFESSLQINHPTIRSYTAQGIDDPTSIARFSYSNTGLHVMISSAHHPTIYIDPYTKDNNYYISYAINNLPADSRSFECLVQESVESDMQFATKNADDGMLRTFRLALACTGEYAQYHLNDQGIDPGETDAVKKAAVLSAMNTAMTRINGVFERDIAITMVLVANNTDIIFLDAGTDPYTNNNGAAMLSQNQTTCNSIIGSPNYDIGHVFSTGGGGIATFQSPCSGSLKARGVTGLPNPIGDFFYIDYVCHEMGHQYGANHTFNNSCGGARSESTAMEPGSGSTILGYAGICPPNVQNTSDHYFHAISIQEMWSFISTGFGQCATQSPTGNLPPTADAGSNYTIPKSTPFILKGIATDPDGGDVLSHNWEQMDNEIGTMPPVNTSVLGPMFRSKGTLVSPERYMPELATVLSGQTQSTWEVAPSVSRTMEFRFTVRDNTAGGASSASDNMIVTVEGDAGPFVITSQATAVTWQTQSTETISWDVANTDTAPVDSPNVDILFSTDGGQTYPVVIANDVPNTGSALVNTPNLNTTTGRIMVISSNNIFYDLNGGVVTVDGELSTDDYEFDNFAIWPNPSQGTVHLSFTPTSLDSIVVSLYDLRGSLVNSNEFESNSNLFEQTLNYNGLDSGLYFVKVSNNGQSETVKLLIH